MAKFKLMLLTILLMVMSGTVLADGRADAYEKNTKVSREIAERYFGFYINKNWDALAPLLADHANFVDPTAEQLFEGVSVWAGKATVLKNFREQYSATTMAYAPLRVLESGKYVVFEGALHWTLTLPKRRIEATLPFMTMLKIENGLIVEHRDMADYQAFIAAEKATRLIN